MIDTNHDISGLPDPVQDAQFYSGVPFKRLLAWIIDSVLVFALATGIVLLSFGVASFFFPMLVFIGNLVYRAFTLIKNSSTWGMQIVGIEIRNKNGNRLTQDEAIWHTFTWVFGAFVPFTLLASAIMMLVNNRGQGLHDYLLGMTAINRPVDK